MDVLVVDDDADVRGVVRRALEREGVLVEEAANGHAAIAAQDARRPDIVVLDLDLPDLHGLDVLAQLRRHDPEVRVLLLTGLGREADRVRGLVSGADDYVVKPFSTRELAARVLALARRVTRTAPAVIHAGRLAIDVAAREVRVEGRPVELPRRELDLLVHLASNPNRALTKEELLRDVWLASPEWLGDATVVEHVRRLRQRIERDPSRPELIVTVRGGGYRFVLPAPDPAVGAAARLGCAVVVVGTTIVDVTDEVVTLVGVDDKSDLLGRDLFDFVSPTSHAATRTRHARTETGPWPPPEQLTVRRVDGTDVEMLVSSGPAVHGGAPARRVQLWPVA